MESRSVRLLGKPGRRLYWVAGLLMIGAVVEAHGLFAALGDLGNPARACAALAVQPALATSPKPFTCIGGTFSWWDITITGRLHGRPIRTHTASQRLPWATPGG